MAFAAWVAKTQAAGLYNPTISILVTTLVMLSCVYGAKLLIYSEDEVYVMETPQQVPSEGVTLFCLIVGPLLAFTVLQEVDNLEICWQGSKFSGSWQPLTLSSLGTSIPV